MNCGRVFVQHTGGPGSDVNTRKKEKKQGKTNYTAKLVKLCISGAL